MISRLTMIPRLIRTSRTSRVALLLIAVAVAFGAYLVQDATKAAGNQDSYLTGAATSGLRVNLARAAEIRPTGKLREYSLVAKPGKWELLPGVTADVLAYNGTVPGPTIRVTEGDTIKVSLKNELEQETSIHWHGLHVPNAMDGVPGLTQAPVKPGETFTYEFLASHAGTFMYHPHHNSVEQIDRGLYGLLVIDPQRPDELQFDREFTMMLGAWNLDAQTGGGASGAMSGMGGMAMSYNYFTINGKAYPSTAPWTAKVGDKVRVRIVNISNLVHPMHLHGQDFKVIAKDGEPLGPANQQVMNTLAVNAGETYDIAFVADNPGQWVFHCHELHHLENNGVEPGGLIQMIAVGGSAGSPTAPPAIPTPPTSAPKPTQTMPAGMPGMSH